MAATANTQASTSAPAATPVSGSTAFFTPQRIKLLSYAGSVLLVIAAAAWFMVTAAKRKEAYASRALDEARNAAEQGNMGVAVQGFTKVTTTYKGTGAAYEAALGIAQARLVSGQSELAIASLTDFLKSNPPANYAAPGNGLLGTAFENTSRWAEAQAAYRKASDLYDVDYLKASALLDAGRAARLGGKRDEAAAIYREILAKYGKTAAQTEAQIRLAEITGGQP
jgi:TolA-binding protein